MEILKKTGIVVDGQFYTEAAVKAALAGVKGEPVAVSGVRKDSVVLSVPTEKGILVAYDDGGGNEYPGINVDVLTRDDDGKALIGLATIENAQSDSNGDKGGLTVHVYGDANDDAPTYSVIVAGQDKLAPQTEDDVKTAGAAQTTATMSYMLVAVRDGYDDVTSVGLRVIDPDKIPGFSDNPYQAVGKALQEAAKDSGRGDDDWDEIFGIPAVTLANHGLAFDYGTGLIIADGLKEIAQSDFN